MGQVSVRDLRNHGGDVLDRVEAGECVTVTRNGKAVAELRPLPKKPLSREELVARWRHLPYVDPEKLRAELDEILDSSLFRSGA